MLFFDGLSVSVFERSEVQTTHDNGLNTGRWTWTEPSQQCLVSCPAVQHSCSLSPASGTPSFIGAPDASPVHAPCCCCCLSCCVPKLDSSELGLKQPKGCRLDTGENSKITGRRPRTKFGRFPIGDAGCAQQPVCAKLARCLVFCCPFCAYGPQGFALLMTIHPLCCC